MVLKKEGPRYIFQKQWGRLMYGLQHIHMKKTETILSDRSTGLVMLMKTLEEKEKRGYRLSDELRLI